jgi:adenylate cyclase class 2
MSRKIAYKDFTIKAVITNLAALEKALTGMKANFAGTDHQKDTYFSVPRGKLKLREGTIENLITHYERVDERGVERTIVYQYDLTPTPEQVDKLRREHEVLGVVEKERRIFFIENVKIHIDKTANGKTFVEVEAIDSNDSKSLEQLRAQCLSIKEKLGIKDVELVKSGYFQNQVNE